MTKKHLLLFFVTICCAGCLEEDYGGSQWWDWLEKRVLSESIWKYSFGLSASLGFRWYLVNDVYLEGRSIAGANVISPDSLINFAAFDQYCYRFAGMVGFRF